MSLDMTDKERIEYLENEIAGLNRVIALHNEDKYQEKITNQNKKLSIEEINLESFSTEGNLFTKVMVSKHADSDYVNITFVPNEGKVLRIYLTEKSYLKLHEVIDVFKLKSINTRQFEEN